jgi:serine/threonine-protein kinase HipA
MSPAITVHAMVGTRTASVGTLWMRDAAGASFRYGEEWLRDGEAYALAPTLPLAAQVFHTRSGEALFGAFADSTPDRWGQMLIQRAHAAGRRNGALGMREYLLGVSDVTRIGNLRYSVEGGPYLAEGADVPQLTRLGALMAAADTVETENAGGAGLELLLAPGSSLGGARPKANVVDGNGVLTIAKFEREADTYPVIPWEAATLAMARDAGIDVPAFALREIGRRRVLLLERFDRREDRRVAFLSALALLDASGGEDGSYVEMAEAIRRHGATAEADLAQLWRRLAFTVLVTNTDNHLRNHAFVRRGGDAGWRLAPAFDINPTPKSIRPRILTLPVIEGFAVASLDAAIEVAPRFGLALDAARAIARDIARVTAQWRTYGRSAGLTARELTFMETAFEHGELELALRL